MKKKLSIEPNDKNISDLCKIFQEKFNQSLTLSSDCNLKLKTVPFQFRSFSLGLSENEKKHPKATQWVPFERFLKPWLPITQRVSLRGKRARTKIVKNSFSIQGNKKPLPFVIRSKTKKKTRETAKKFIFLESALVSFHYVPLLRNTSAPPYQVPLQIKKKSTLINLLRVALHKDRLSNSNLVKKACPPKSPSLFTAQPKIKGLRFSFALFRFLTWLPLKKRFFIKSAAEPFNKRSSFNVIKKKKRFLKPLAFLAKLKKRKGLKKLSLFNLKFKEDNFFDPSFDRSSVAKSKHNREPATTEPAFFLSIAKKKETALHPITLRVKSGPLQQGNNLEHDIRKPYRRTPPFFSYWLLPFVGLLTLIPDSKPLILPTDLKVNTLSFNIKNEVVSKKENLISVNSFSLPKSDSLDFTLWVGKTRSSDFLMKAKKIPLAFILPQQEGDERSSAFFKKKLKKLFYFTPKSKVASQKHYLKRGENCFAAALPFSFGRAAKTSACYFFSGFITSKKEGQPLRTVFPKKIAPVVFSDKATPFEEQNRKTSVNNALQPISLPAQRDLAARRVKDGKQLGTLNKKKSVFFQIKREPVKKLEFPTLSYTKAYLLLENIMKKQINGLFLSNQKVVAIRGPLCTNQKRATTFFFNFKKTFEKSSSFHLKLKVASCLLKPRLKKIHTKAFVGSEREGSDSNLKFSKSPYLFWRRLQKLNASIKNPKKPISFLTPETELLNAVFQKKSWVNRTPSAKKKNLSLRGSKSLKNAFVFNKSFKEKRNCFAAPLASLASTLRVGEAKPKVEVEGDLASTLRVREASKRHQPLVGSHPHFSIKKTKQKIYLQNLLNQLTLFRDLISDSTPPVFENLLCYPNSNQNPPSRKDSLRKKDASFGPFVLKNKKRNRQALYKGELSGAKKMLLVFSLRKQEKAFDKGKHPLEEYKKREAQITGHYKLIQGMLSLKNSLDQIFVSSNFQNTIIKSQGLRFLNMAPFFKSEGYLTGSHVKNRKKLSFFNFKAKRENFFLKGPERNNCLASQKKRLFKIGTKQNIKDNKKIIEDSYTAWLQNEFDFLDNAVRFTSLPPIEGLKERDYAHKSKERTLYKNSCLSLFHSNKKTISRVIKMQHPILISGYTFAAKFSFLNHKAFDYAKRGPQLKENSFIKPPLPTRAFPHFSGGKRHPITERMKSDTKVLKGKTSLISNLFVHSFLNLNSSLHPSAVKGREFFSKAAFNLKTAEFLLEPFAGDLWSAPRQNAANFLKVAESKRRHWENKRTFNFIHANREAIKMASIKQVRGALFAARHPNQGWISFKSIKERETNHFQHKNKIIRIRKGEIKMRIDKLFRCFLFSAPHPKGVASLGYATRRVEAREQHILPTNATPSIIKNFKSDLTLRVVTRPFWEQLTKSAKEKEPNNGIFWKGKKANASLASREVRDPIFINHFLPLPLFCYPGGKKQSFSFFKGVSRFPHPSGVSKDEGFDLLAPHAKPKTQAKATKKAVRFFPLFYKVKRRSSPFGELSFQKIIFFFNKIKRKKFFKEASRNNRSSSLTKALVFNKKGWVKKGHATHNKKEKNLLFKNRFDFSKTNVAKQFFFLREKKQGLSNFGGSKNAFLFHSGGKLSFVQRTPQSEQNLEKSHYDITKNAIKNSKKKRRALKQKRETGRLLKRKRFHPRPAWLRVTMHKKLLKYRHIKNTDLACLAARNKQPFFATQTALLSLRGKQPLRASSCFPSILATRGPKDGSEEGKAEKEFSSISQSVFAAFQQGLWKSSWLRSNLNSYLRKIKTSFNLIKQTSQNSELGFVTKKMISDCLGLTKAPYAEWEPRFGNAPFEKMLKETPRSCFARFPRFYPTRFHPSGEGSEGVASTLHPLGDKVRGSERPPSQIRRALYIYNKAIPKTTGFKKCSSLNLKWNTVLQIAEYNQITYHRIQQIITNMKHSLGKEGAKRTYADSLPKVSLNKGPFGESPVEASKEESSFNNIATKPGPFDTNKHHPFNNAHHKLKRKATEGSASKSSNLEPSTFSFNLFNFANTVIQTPGSLKSRIHQKLKEQPFFTLQPFGNMSQKRIYWALNKTHMWHFKNSNKKEYLWANQKQREQNRSNKTKKIIKKILSLPLQEQYPGTTVLNKNNKNQKGPQKGLANVEKWKEQNKKSLNTFFKKQEQKEIKMGDLGFLDSNGPHSNLLFMKDLFANSFKESYNSNWIPFLDEATRVKGQKDLLPAERWQRSFTKKAEEQSKKDPYKATRAVFEGERVPVFIKEHKMFLRNLKNTLRVSLEKATNSAPVKIIKFRALMLSKTKMKRGKAKGALLSSLIWSSSSSQDDARPSGGVEVGAKSISYVRHNFLTVPLLRNFANQKPLLAVQSKQGPLIKKHTLINIKKGANTRFMKLALGSNYSTPVNFKIPKPFLCQAKPRHPISLLAIQDRRVKDAFVLQSKKAKHKPLLSESETSTFVKSPSFVGSFNQPFFLRQQKEQHRVQFFMSQAACLLCTIIFHLCSLFSLISLSQIRCVIKFLLLLAIKLSSLVKIFRLAKSFKHKTLLMAPKIKLRKVPKSSPFLSRNSLQNLLLFLPKASSTVGVIKKRSSFHLKLKVASLTFRVEARPKGVAIAPREAAPRLSHPSGGSSFTLASPTRRVEASRVEARERFLKPFIYAKGQNLSNRGSHLKGSTFEGKKQEGFQKEKSRAFFRQGAKKMPLAFFLTKHLPNPTRFHPSGEGSEGVASHPSSGKRGGSCFFEKKNQNQKGATKLNTFLKVGSKKLGFVFHTGLSKVTEIRNTSTKNASVFLGKPGESLSVWINHLFLIEIAADSTTTIPENSDLSLWNSYAKLAKSSSTIPIFGTLLEKRLLSSFEFFLERVSQPDTDLIVRQRKGTIFLDNLLFKTSFNNVESAENQRFSLRGVLPSFLAKLKKQKGPLKTRTTFIFELKRSAFFEPLLFNRRVTDRMEKNSTIFDWVRREGPPYYPLGEGLASSLRGHRFPHPKGGSEKGEKRHPLKELQNIGNSKVFLLDMRVRKRWSANQFITFKGKDSDLLIHAPPAPKSFHSLYPSPLLLRPPTSQNQKNANHKTVALLAKTSTGKPQHHYNFNAEGVAPLGTIVCQIYSGLFSKETAKSCLVVGIASKSSNYDEKSLLIQSLAGETEMKIIRDNANRYNFALGIKSLRNVFDALALHTPCIFLIEDIHVIGEKRPLLVGDDENADRAESSGESHDEKNLSVAKLTRHSIMHYKKPFRGDFSSLIPANNFSFDLFLENDLINQALASRVARPRFPHPKGGSEEGIATKPTFLMPKNSVDELPWIGGLVLFQKSTSPLVVSHPITRRGKGEKPQGEGEGWEARAKTPSSLMRKEQKGRRRRSSPITCFSKEPEVQKGLLKIKNSIRVKIALLANLAVSNLSVKLNMITDLLVIIDGVRSNRGFVVFATTHIPSSLDPALRRPGRLDETIVLPFLPKLENRWEIVKAHFARFPDPASPTRRVSAKPKGEQNASVWSRPSCPISFFAAQQQERNEATASSDSFFLKSGGPLTPSLSLLWLSNLSRFYPTRFPRSEGGKSETPFVFLSKSEQHEVFPTSSLSAKRGLADTFRLGEAGKAKAEYRFLSLPNLIAIAYSKIGKLLINNRFANCAETNLSLFSTLHSQLENQQNQIHILEPYLHLYTTQSIVKQYLMGLFAPKVAETFAFSGLIKKKSLEKITGPFLLATQDPASSLIFTLIEKRLIYKKNVIIPRLLQFYNAALLSLEPSFEASFLLLPAKRYENYKQTFLAMQKLKPASMPFGAESKVSNIESGPFDSSDFDLGLGVERQSVSAPQHGAFGSKQLTRGEEFFDKPTAFDRLFRSQMLNRHRGYLNNQWWNGQLFEHNVETTFLSDIDWRSNCFASKKGKPLKGKAFQAEKTTPANIWENFYVDFPDFDQHYNPGNRRWVLHYGYWSYWSNYKTEHNSKIYSFMAAESFQETFNYLNSKRELVDYFVTKLIKTGSLKDINVIDGTKRF